MTVATDLDRHSVIDLTEGRVSGRPHTTQIWFARPEETIYLPLSIAVDLDPTT